MTEIKSTRRNDMVSIAKGIGIVLMVIGHSGMEVFNWFIYMFHMPLFVVLAGYCFKEYYLDHQWSFVKRRIRGLYLPVVIFGFVMVLCHNIFYSWGMYGDETTVNHHYELSETMREFMHVLELKFLDPLAGVLWFVRELFWSSLIVIALSRIIVRCKWLWAVIFVALAMIFRYFNIELIAQELTYTTWLFCALYCVGWFFKQHWKPTPWWVTVLLMALVAALSFPAHGALSRLRFEVMLPYLLGAVAGTVMTMNVSHYLARHSNWVHRCLVYIGNNTMIILLLHLLCFKLVTACIIGCQGLPWERLADYPVLQGQVWSWWIYVLVGIGLPLLAKASWKKLRASIQNLIARK